MSLLLFYNASPNNLIDFQIVFSILNDFINHYTFTSLNTLLFKTSYIFFFFYWLPLSIQYRFLDSLSVFFYSTILDIFLFLPHRFWFHRSNMNMNIIRIEMNSCTPHCIFQPFRLQHFTYCFSGCFINLFFIQYFCIGIIDSLLREPTIIKRKNGLPHQRTVLLRFRKLFLQQFLFFPDLNCSFQK